MTDDTSSKMYFNGINGATGGYGLKPMTEAEFAQAILRQGKPDTDMFSFRPMYGVDARELSQTGWGIIFPFDKDHPDQSTRRVAQLKEALSELIAWRQQQAGSLYRIFEGPKKVEGGYRLGESKADFLRRKGVGSGAVDPRKGVPYYLLLVGSPDDIPYRFQNELDVQYAVGRIDFGDDWEAYANYAHSIVCSEKGEVQVARKLSFFGAESQGDRATEMSARYLVRPLYKSMMRTHNDWTIQPILKQQATKDQLGHLLGGDDMPAVLFTASHGMEFPNGDARQLPAQGALLCSDWPGPAQWHDPIPERFYFAGHDIASDHNLMGPIDVLLCLLWRGDPRCWMNSPSKRSIIASQLPRVPLWRSSPPRCWGTPRVAR